MLLLWWWWWLVVIESESSRQQFCDAEWQRSQMRCKGHVVKPLLQVIKKKNGDTCDII